MRNDKYNLQQRNIFYALRARNSNPKHPGFTKYQWLYKSVDSFFEDVGMKPMPYKDFYLSRKDSTLPFQPGNCEWVPRYNPRGFAKGARVFVDTPEGQISYKELSETYGLSISLIDSRNKRGLCFNCIISSKKLETFECACRPLKANSHRAVSAKLGISYQAVSSRKKQGWCENCAENLPRGGKCNHVFSNKQLKKHIQNLPKNRFKILRDKELRDKYVKDTVIMGLKSQILSLRYDRNLSQSELADLIKTKQSVISRLERNPKGVSLPTLLKLASVFDVGLTVRFEAIDTLVDWNSNPTQKKMTPRKSEIILEEISNELPVNTK